MTCTQCKSRNPVGNKFCRECGAALTLLEGSLEAEEAARIEAERRQEQVASLLADAFRKSEQREYAAALPLVEEAVTLMPDSTSAQAMLSTVYERLGRNEEAIAATERVVELNPDSTADKQRLDQLRRGIHVPPRTGAEGKSRSFAPYLPMVVAGSVAALVLLIGLSVLNRGRAAGQTPAAVVAEAPTGAEGSAEAAEPGLNDTPQQKSYLPPPDSREDPFAPLTPAAARTEPSPSTPRTTPLPRPAENASITAVPAPSHRFIPPAPVAVPENVARSGSGGGNGGLPYLTAAENTSGGFGAGGRIAVGPPQASGSGADDAGATAASQEPPQNDGLPPGSYIKVKVGAPSAGSGGSSPDPSSSPSSVSMPIENPMARAQRLQSSGRYKEAITAYREALSSGAAAGEAYQGIARSYERLGDSTAARSAYHDALRAYESQAASGRNADAAQRGIASCKAALEVLGG
jgi:tetratricopeptide (TPR) repeat protein